MHVAGRLVILSSIMIPNVYCLLFLLSKEGVGVDSPADAVLDGTDRV